MKKIVVIGAAALCATVAMGAIESSEIVGYSQIPLRDGFYMQGAAFQTIATEGMKLSEMIPVGYLNNAKYMDAKKGHGCLGDIYLAVLNANGGTALNENGDERKYHWEHLWDKTTGWAAKGRWIQRTVREGKVVEVEITGENDVVFNNGEALWICVGTAYQEGMTISHAGAALLDAAALPLRDGFKGMSAPLSSACKLSKIIPVGYLNNARYMDAKKGHGCLGDIYLAVLNANGGTALDENGNERKYHWEHLWDKTNGWAEKGRWIQRTVQDGKVVEVEITGENDVEFKMGEGLWVCVGTAYQDGMMLEFPGVDDLKD